MALTPLFAVVFALLAVERGLELALNARNTRGLAAQGARWVERDGFALILAAQVALFGGTAIEVLLAPWSGERPWTVALVLLLVVAQALRYWVIVTLGERWNIRVVTVPGAPRILRGPYRFFRHPNYAAVIVEALALPLAFGAYATFVVVAPLQLVALLRRIRIEEGALDAGTSAST